MPLGSFSKLYHLIMNLLPTNPEPIMSHAIHSTLKWIVINLSWRAKHSVPNFATLNCWQWAKVVSTPRNLQTNNSLMTTSANALTERLNQQQYTPKFQIFFLKSFKTSEISKISEKCPATKQISGKDRSGYHLAAKDSLSYTAYTRRRIKPTRSAWFSHARLRGCAERVHGGEKSTKGGKDDHVRFSRLHALAVPIAERLSKLLGYMFVTTKRVPPRPPPFILPPRSPPCLRSESRQQPVKGDRSTSSVSSRVSLSCTRFGIGIDSSPFLQWHFSYLKAYRCMNLFFWVGSKCWVDRNIFIGSLYFRRSENMTTLWIVMKKICQLWEFFWINYKPNIFLFNVLVYIF